jgi:uncharacterized membrane protein YesL
MTGLYDLRPFIRWTTYDRPTVIVVFTIFVVLGMVKPMLILFGAIDLLGAVWTWLELRSAQQPPP